MQIIIKRGFERHWNRAFDKQPIWISSRKQYDYEMKKRGMVPYDPDMQDAPKRKEYSTTKETRHLVNAIVHQSDKCGNFKPSSKLMGELIKRKVIRKKKEVSGSNKTLSAIDSSKGGFF